MEFEINDVPFEMAEISPKLFNLQFLSDITFVIEGKQIYAHSLELMKRSVVFQNQLETTMGGKMLITITDYGFDVFYQFIRFIYTDECLISKENCYELLKLAKQYKVIRLVNVVQNSGCFSNLMLLDFGVVENHQIALNYLKRDMELSLEISFRINEFLSIHPQTVEEILKCDKVDISELDIIDALIQWMKQHCIQNQIQFAECRNKFENLICLIRFPTLSNEELLDVNTKYPDLLTKSDLSDIAIQKVFGVKCENRIWNDVPRMKIEMPYESKISTTSDNQFETKFSVSSELILAGFSFATCYSFLTNTCITISWQNSELTKTETPINIEIVKQNTFFGIRPTFVSFGSSIRVRPDFTYTIAYKFIPENNSSNAKMEYLCRKPQTDVTINAPPNSVKILQTHETMFEIMFLKPDGQID